MLPPHRWNLYLNHVFSLANLKRNLNKEISHSRKISFFLPLVFLILLTTFFISWRYNWFLFKWPLSFIVYCSLHLFSSLFLISLGISIAILAMPVCFCKLFLTIIYFLACWWILKLSTYLVDLFIQKPIWLNWRCFHPDSICVCFCWSWGTLLFGTTSAPLPSLVQA